MPNLISCFEKTNLYHINGTLIPRLLPRAFAMTKRLWNHFYAIYDKIGQLKMLFRPARRLRDQS